MKSPVIAKQQMGREMALEHYAWGKSQGLEQERLEMLRLFLGEIERLEAPPPAENQPGALPAGPGGPGVPQANPQPPPQSEMIPNVPGIAAAA